MITQGEHDEITKLSEEITQKLIRLTSLVDKCLIDTPENDLHLAPINTHVNLPNAPPIINTTHQGDLDFGGLWETIDGRTIEVVGRHENHLTYKKLGMGDTLYIIKPDKLLHRVPTLEQRRYMRGIENG